MPGRLERPRHVLADLVTTRAYRRAYRRLQSGGGVACSFGQLQGRAHDAGKSTSPTGMDGRSPTARRVRSKQQDGHTVGGPHRRHEAGLVGDYAVGFHASGGGARHDQLFSVHLCDGYESCGRGPTLRRARPATPEAADQPVADPRHYRFFIGLHRLARPNRYDNVTGLSTRKQPPVAPTNQVKSAPGTHACHR